MRFALCRVSIGRVTEAMKRQNRLRILVTGGAGFIGSHLTEALLQRGHMVRVLDNFSTGKRGNLVFEKEYAPLEVANGDISSQASCRKAMKGIEYVFHQAALPSVQRSVEDPELTNLVNAVGTLNILIAAKDVGVRRVIYAASSAAYGDTPTLPKRENMPPNPLSPYALQKYMGEEYCRLFTQLYGLETISLRYFNIFGPKQDPASVYSAVIPKFIEAFVKGRRPVIYGDGKQSRDFTYIDNVVHANLLALSAKHLHGEVVNVACGSRISLNQLVKMLQQIFGSNLSPIYEKPREGDVKNSLADITRAKQVLSYKPLVDIETGLRKTVQYFLKQSSST
jgi:nucleoside-diphosphate-sugar epimerase